MAVPDVQTPDGMVPLVSHLHHAGPACDCKNRETTPAEFILVFIPAGIGERDLFGLLDICHPSAGDPFSCC